MTARLRAVDRANAFKFYYTGPFRIDRTIACSRTDEYIESV